MFTKSFPEDQNGYEHDKLSESLLNVSSVVALEFSKRESTANGMD